MGLTRDEELALLKGLQKKVKARLDVLEADAKDEVLQGYIENGTDRRSLIINGEKVGEIGLSYSKPKAAIKPGYEWVALEYLEGVNLVSKVPSKGWEDRFTLVDGSVVDMFTGEVCDWAEWLPATADKAAIRGCKPDDVIHALRGKLDGVTFAGLLEG